MDMHKYTQFPYQLTEESLLLIHRKQRIFKEITSEYPVSVSKEISAAERESLSLNSISLTYGELDFRSLGEIFETIKNVHGGIPNGIFYDLGSGSGKGVLSAALLDNFHKCIGLEILRGLYEISQVIKTNYDTIRLNLIEEYKDIWNTLPDIEFVQGDMFDIGWGDADFIFANSTCFDTKMMDRIGNSYAKPGTWAVTLTKGLISPFWDILQSFRKKMSWGEATVYIHKRNNVS
jgi:Histone methylation protein DOT1